MRLIPFASLFAFALSGWMAAQTTPPPAKDGLLSSSAVQPSSSIQPVTPANPVPLPGKADPLLDLPNLPRDAKVTLLGGTVTNLSHVDNRMEVNAFGGRKQRVAFDMRTHFYLDDKPAKGRDLKPGQRVYVDTMLVGTTVFAKNVWIRTSAASGEGRGQILSYDSSRGVLEVRDELTSQPANLHVSSATVIRVGEKTGTAADLKPGSIITMKFGPGQERGSELREVSVLAAPGAQFAFVGAITYIDLSRNMIAIRNRSDDRTYELYLVNLPSSQFRNLRQGSVANIQAEFDGSRYIARTLQVLPAQNFQQQP